MTRTLQDNWESVAFLLMCGSILLLVLGSLLLWLGLRPFRTQTPTRKWRGRILISASCLLFLTSYWVPSFAFYRHYGAHPLNDFRNPSNKNRSISLDGTTREFVLRHHGSPHILIDTPQSETWFYWCDFFCLNWEAVSFGPDGKVIGVGIN